MLSERDLRHVVEQVNSRFDAIEARVAELEKTQKGLNMTQKGSLAAKKLTEKPSGVKNIQRVSK